MKKSIYTLMCLFIAMLTCQQAKAQDLIYSADFESDNEGWTAEGDYSGKYGMWEVKDGVIHGNAYMATGPCQSYFVSPLFTLGASENQVTYRQQGFYFNDFAQEAKLVIRENGGNWIEIQGIQYPEAYEMASSGMLDIPEELNGKEVQLGFFYNLTSTENIGDWYIQEVQVYGKNAAEPEEPALSYDKDKVTYDMSSGVPFEAPVLNNPKDLWVSFTSSDASVASVNGKGEVSIEGVGFTVITASSNECSASYELTVTDSNVIFGASFAVDNCGFTEYNEVGVNAWIPEFKSMKADAYGMVEQMTDFYLVSPEITLDPNGNTVSFVQMANYFDDFNNEAQLVIREKGGEWVKIEGVTEPSLGMGFENTGELTIPSEFNGKIVEIAFKYSSGGTDFDSGVWYVKNFNVRKVKSDAKADPAIAFDQTEVAYTMGDEFVAPVLSNPNNVAVTFSSSDENVATVAEDGTVTVLGEGVTTIKAVSAETEKYLAGEASYVLTVNAQGVEADVLFEESFASGLGDFTEENADGTSGFWQWFFITQSAYATGANNSRLVSPEIQLETQNTVSFSYRAMDFSDLASQVFFSIREVGGEWTDMELPILDNDANWMDVEFAIPAEYDNKKVQVAVRYTTSDNATLCVKNLVVKGVKGTDVPTGINGITAEDLNSGKIYDIQGRKLNKLQKGVNIVNGKKIIVR